MTETLWAMEETRRPQRWFRQPGIRFLGLVLIALAFNYGPLPEHRRTAILVACLLLLAALLELYFYVRTVSTDRKAATQAPADRSSQQDRTNSAPDP